ncbi:MAG TPA: DUF4838 domain-containing protein [Opitutaceae bacterium]
MPPPNVQTSLFPVRPTVLLAALAVTLARGSGVLAASENGQAQSDLVRLCPDKRVRFVLRLNAADAKYEEAYHVRSDPAANTVTITGGSPFALRLGANAFCTQVLGVRWLTPAPDGEFVPPFAPGWHLPAIDLRARPSFASRWLWGLTWRGDSAAADLWAARNGLRERWEHAHAQLHVVPWILYGSHPEYFPEWEGRRYCPSVPNDYNWQPAFTQPGVIARSVSYIQARLGERPDRPTISLSINDSIRFDQSPDSLAARGPLRWFRGRPDYSNLVFGYMNRVADAARTDRLLSAYAYDWCENTPSFRVRPNVLPWLTADRTQWYDSEFRSQDQALIRRWTRAGPKAVGIYDYLYGAPYLVPRLTPHLIADSIRFEREVGVRGYFAECNAHWAYDAPKLWMAAQLLQNAKGNADGLLDEFYTDYFGPAADPMKAFYDECEAAWLHQPGPARWNKFYYDIDQAVLFPKCRRASLWAHLEAAATSAAGNSKIRRRVQLVGTAFAATDRFCQWYEGTVEAAQVARAFQRATSIGALSPVDLSAYLRVSDGRASAGPDGDWKPAPLADPQWSELAAPTALNDLTFTWNAAPWLARGEPSEHRSIVVRTLPDGFRAVSFRGAADEHLSQWCPAAPSALYCATVRFQGHVSPANEADLLVVFSDALGRPIGQFSEARVRPGSYPVPVPLTVRIRAPAAAAGIGVALYARHQTDADSAEFSHLALLLSRR